MSIKKIILCLIWTPISIAQNNETSFKTEIQELPKTVLHEQPDVIHIRSINTIPAYFSEYDEAYLDMISVEPPQWKKTLNWLFLKSLPLILTVNSSYEFVKNRSVRMLLLTRRIIRKMFGLRRAHGSKA